MPFQFTIANPTLVHLQAFEFVSFSLFALIINLYPTRGNCLA